MTNKDQCREAFEHDRRVAATRALSDGLQRQGIYMAWPTVTGLVDIVSAARSAPAAPVELPEPFALYDGEKWYANEEAAICSCANMQKLQKIYTEQQVRELLAAAPKLPQGDGWIPVGEQLPESGKPVLLDTGKKYPIRAMWVSKFTLVATGDDTDWGEYSEDCDEYFCTEGWYEWNEHEETHWNVSVEPLRWMPLPHPPKEVKK